MNAHTHRIKDYYYLKEGNNKMDDDDDDGQPALRIVKDKLATNSL